MKSFIPLQTLNFLIRLPKNIFFRHLVYLSEQNSKLTSPNPAVRRKEKIVCRGPFAPKNLLLNNLVLQVLLKKR